MDEKVAAHEKVMMENARKQLESLMTSITWKGKRLDEMTVSEQREYSQALIPKFPRATNSRKHNRWPMPTNYDLEDSSKMSDDDLVQGILFATTYRSGEDSCNSLYMGGMAHSMMKHSLSKDAAVRKLLQENSAADYDRQVAVADRVTLVYVWENHARNYVRNAAKNPVQHCPCCGSIAR